VTSELKVEDTSDEVADDEEEETEVALDLALELVMARLLELVEELNTEETADDEGETLEVATELLGAGSLELTVELNTEDTADDEGELLEVASSLELTAELRDVAADMETGMELNVLGAELMELVGMIELLVGFALDPVEELDGAARVLDTTDEIEENAVEPTIEDAVEEIKEDNTRVELLARTIDEALEPDNTILALEEITTLIPVLEEELRDELNKELGVVAELKDEAALLWLIDVAEMSRLEAVELCTDDDKEDIAE